MSPYFASSQLADVTLPAPNAAGQSRKRSLAMPSQADHRNLHIERIGEVTAVRLAGPKIMEEKAVEDINKELLGLLEDPGPRKVVVCLAAVEGMTSSMVATLVNYHRRIKAAKGRLALCGLQPRLADTFKTLRLSRLLNLYESEEQAVQSF
jgi:anti-anti-sigma factor